MSVILLKCQGHFIHVHVRFIFHASFPVYRAGQRDVTSVVTAVLKIAEVNAEIPCCTDVCRST